MDSLYTLGVHGKQEPSDVQHGLVPALSSAFGVYTWHGSVLPVGRLANLIARWSVSSTLCCIWTTFTTRTSI